MQTGWRYGDFCREFKGFGDRGLEEEGNLINFTESNILPDIEMKNTSPYSAALTGGGFLFKETDALLPLLLSSDRKNLLKDEKENNRLLQINAEKSRSKAILEISRRFDTMTPAFWNDYMVMDEDDRRIALLFVILKTYKICFDFHVNVTMKKWNSIEKMVKPSDLMIEFNNIACRDEFVDSWSDNTKDRVASAYSSILRKAGMMDANGELNAVQPSNADYYLRIGEPWFLEACLLAPYQIENIKKQMKP